MSHVRHWRLVAVLAVGAVIVFVVVQHLPAPRDSSDWAAWVQAVGSVVAIAAAIWIDRRAARHQRELVQREEALAHRVRAEVGAALFVQASQIQAMSESVWVELSDAHVSAARARVRYAEWVEDVEEQIGLLKVMLERTSDPLLVLHVVHFIRAAKPMPPAGIPLPSIASSVNSTALKMGDAKMRLAGRAGELARKAGFTDDEYLSKA